ncbi:MAG: 3-oxoacyl-ACP synthase [Bacteroidetes bacterium HGW-Bacteroidetes-6]|jgi:3-oxoacyl-[acyl-carrier-protein] synthase-3|nr:MAG: 3-oxoacyl-ACP synthase [Bacteroidetes bacterium HGW-Bacteroidetes-6]
MFINRIFHYLPENRLDNAYFAQKTGMSEADIFKKSGIKTRLRAGVLENTNNMSLKAVAAGNGQYPFELQTIDLIIGATYTAFDNIATIAHEVQRKFNIAGARALMVSSACSSYVNAMEIIQGYYATGKTDHSLVLAVENNSRFSCDSNPQAGHLWGDAATATFISREKVGKKSLRVIDVISEGMGQMGVGPNGVFLRPVDGGLQMPEGRDVFVKAIEIMTRYINDIVERNGFQMSDVQYVVPHQANARIINQISKNLAFPVSNVLMNIEKYGNTGCASTPLVLSENWDCFQFGDLIALAVFGGGYSAGAMLLRVV